MDGTVDYRRLLDFAREKVAVVDRSGTFRYVNDAVRDVLGMPPERLVGTDAFERVHPDDERRVRAGFEAVVEAGVEPRETLRYRFADADGDWYWLETATYPPEVTGIDGYVLSTRDVTEEVRSRRRLEAITRRSPDVSWMFSADWNELLFVSDAVSDVFGVSAETLVERPQAFLEKIHLDDRPYVERSMERLSAGESTELDYRVNPDEEFGRWVRVPAEPVYENGEVARIVGVARDVTEEYKRNRQLAVMDTLLRHTVRNDMNVITGTASLIAEQTDDEALRTHAETIRRVGEGLVDTAEKQRDVIDLLDSSGSPRPTDVGSLLADAVAAVHENHPDVTVSVAAGDDLRAFTVSGMVTALTELLDNAVEHATAEPDVRVRAERVDDTVEVAVQDNCPPIPNEELLVLTDRHELTDLTHTVGMGLWLVYWAVDRSGGDLTFDAGEDGNVVVVTLPAVGDASDEEAAPESVAGAATADGGLHGESRPDTPKNPEYPPGSTDVSDRRRPR